MLEDDLRYFPMDTNDFRRTLNRQDEQQEMGMFWKPNYSLHFFISYQSSKTASICSDWQHDTDGSDLHESKVDSFVSLMKADQSNANWLTNDLLNPAPTTSDHQRESSPSSLIAARPESNLRLVNIKEPVKIKRRVWFSTDQGELRLQPATTDKPIETKTRVQNATEQVEFNHCTAMFEEPIKLKRRVWYGTDQGELHLDLAMIDEAANNMPRPITEEQLMAEAKGIYAGLVMVEAKFLEVSPEETMGHRPLLREHHDFFLAKQHPSASSELRRLASKYATVPAHIWSHSCLPLVPNCLQHLQMEAEIPRDYEFYLNIGKYRKISSSKQFYLSIVSDELIFRRGTGDG